MNTQIQEALKMAIEAMERAEEIDWELNSLHVLNILQAIQACKEALEQTAMTYEQGFAHGYEAHRVEQENEKQQSIINIWDEMCELEQPAQEPINNCPNCNSWFTKEIHSIPAPSWQGLSDDEMLFIAKYNWDDNDFMVFGCAIEQALKEKNT